MQNWQLIESLPIFRNCTSYKTKYVRHIRFLISIALFLAFGTAIFVFFLIIWNQNSNLNYFTIVAVEHWLYIVATVHFIVVHFGNGANILSELAKDLFPQLVSESEQLPIYVSLLLCFMNECAVFVWNYLDLFIMIVGIGLSTLFEILNQKLERALVHIEVISNEKQWFSNWWRYSF